MRTIPSRPRTEDGIDIGVAVVAFLIYLPIATFLTAWMGSWLWNMVLPELFGVRRIGIVDAFGIAVVIDFFTYQYRPEAKQDVTILERVSKAIGASIGVKVMFLAMGLTYAWLA